MRFWEIDFARGLAVVAMVLFNWAFALSYLGIYVATDSWLFWNALPRAIGGSFIFIAGLSLWISYSRNKSAHKHLLRGGKIFLIGVGITIATLLTFPSDAIIFGILHLIGLSVVLGYFLVRLNAKILAALSALVIAAGAFIQTQTFSFPHLVWLGFIPSNFSTLDYFPLLPWLGVFAIGIVFGKEFYAKKKTRPNKHAITYPITFLGRHSLVIYIIHQPILLGALFALHLL